MGKVADILAKAGHEVILYQPVYNDNITVSGSKLARVIERPRDFDLVASLDEMQSFWGVKEQGFSDMKKIISIVSTSHSTLCKRKFFVKSRKKNNLDQLNDRKLMEKLRTEKFDLALGEHFDPCYYGVIEYINIDKYVTIISTALLDNAASTFGIPSSPSHVPGMVAEIPPFSYSYKAKNLFFTIMSSLFTTPQFFTPVEQVVRPIIRPDFNIMEKRAQSAFILVNADEHMDFNRPISHKIVYIGGIGQSSSKPLEPKFEEIMSNAKKGMIFVSFGSVAESHKMAPEMKIKFLEAFAKFPDVTFLWKYEKDEDKIAEGYKNVITGKWCPQTDLLAHPKLLAFITHGGANSIAEVAFAGVPVICIPLYGDQHRNGQLVKYRKIGVTISKKEIMKDKLDDAITAILNDKKSIMDTLKAGRKLYWIWTYFRHETQIGKITTVYCNG